MADLWLTLQAPVESCPTCDSVPHVVADSTGQMGGKVIEATGKQIRVRTRRELEAALIRREAYNWAMWFQCRDHHENWGPVYGRYTDGKQPGLVDRLAGFDQTTD